MQPTDSFNVSRRTLDVEDYIDILRRHKSWIFGPFLLCVVASVVGVFLWPDKYVSEAKIKITPQQVPENMVPSTINQGMWDRILSMDQEIRSRNVLTSIIQSKNLYPKDRVRMPMDDVVEEMHKDIVVAPLVPQNSTNRVIPAFLIQFTYENKYLAQQVVADLMSRFIDASVRNNSTRTHESTQFFKDGADAAKKTLDEIENQLTEFQVKNNGHLPDQADSNMHSLMALEATLSGLNGSLQRANSEKLQLESTIRILQDQGTQIAKVQNEPPPLPTVGSIQRSERVAETEREVQRIKDGLTGLRSKYGEGHPDVQNAVVLLVAAEKKHEEALKEEAAKREEARKEEESKKDGKGEPVVARTNPVVFRDQLERNGRIQSMQAQVEARNLEIEGLNKEIKQRNEEIRMFQGRLESGPSNIKQYTDLLRDREMAKQKYLEADDKLSKSQRSQSMEDRNQGERLEPLDTASLPTDPTEPKRPMVISIGAGIGLLLGVVIVGAREMKDTSLKNLKDVRAYTQMAVLGSIPLLENDFVVKRRRRLAWLGWTTACLVAVVVMVGAIVYYESTRGGVQ
jgi:succinoglycan biosynthesis transport protein ExoP